MKFRESDIRDKERLEKMVKKEANAIYSSLAARKGRDLETVEFCVRQGKVAELFLIENFGYEESDIKWHDLKKGDEYTEVKAYCGVNDRNVPFVEKDLRRLKNESWSRSKWYILFNVVEGEYTLVEKIQIR